MRKLGTQTLSPLFSTSESLRQGGGLASNQTMVGEQLAFVVLRELVSKLSSGLWADLGLLWNFEQDLENIKGTLRTLQAVLKDAERRSINDESVRLWLKSLKAAAYDIEDMLNDFDTQKKPEDSAASKKVKRFFSRSNPLTSRDSMAHKMKKMRERLQKIAEEKSKYALKAESVTDKQEEIKKRETFSLVEGTKVLGREAEKGEIIKRLLATDSKTNVSVISIVGIGGLGKTTLAKLIFNDASTSIFDLKIWVHAMEFDVKKLANAIVSSGSGQRCDFDDLESTSQCVKILLHGKRYLMVLDDVWNEDEDKWEKLKLMLEVGNSGSRILVTTRSLQVAKMMSGTENPHSLTYLSDDDCWKLFEQRAFGQGGGQRTPSLEKIGKEIVRKCGGVPLAANALGGTLRRASGEEAWKDVRDNGIWEIEQQYENGQLSENKILASLKVSYQYMPSPLKLCFFYCSIYPKSFGLEKDKLIQQWIAQGFIQSQRESRSLEIGESYVNDLLSVSFLQDRKAHEKTGDLVYKMHDLVYDFARSIAGDEVLAVAAGKETTRNVKECRYASIIGYDDPSKLRKALPKKARALHFRTRLLVPLPDDAFSQTRYVRVLDLSGCFLDELPTSVGELKQLRYLDASESTIQSSGPIVKLWNLEVLNLRDCPINELPSTIGELQKLYLLNLSGCLNISTLPPSIGDLHRLLYLDLSGCYELLQLPESIWSLINLRSLNLHGCFRLKTLHQSFGHLKRLKHLDLSNCSSLLELPESVGNLQNLQTLILRSCQFKVLPETLSNLINLETLDLAYCSSLRQLPKSIGNLQNLQTLILHSCRFEVLPETLSNLINLETLDLTNCLLDHMPSRIGRLTKLRGLHKFIVGDTVVEGGRASSSRSRGCNIAELEHLNLLTGDLEILFKCGVDPDDAKRANFKEKEIQSLTLNWNFDKQSGTDHAAILHHLVPHRNLKFLKISDFLGVNFPSWMVKETDEFLPNLVEIKLSGMLNCDCVPVLGQLRHLRKIELRSMPRIRSISTIDLCGYGSDRATSFPSLEEFLLSNMPNLEEWVTEDDDNDNNRERETCCAFPCLRDLYINKCPSLRIRPRIPPSVVCLTLPNNSNALLQSAEVKTWKDAGGKAIFL
ncbi:putative disease resistance protein RGA1 [Typha latifolia]|uniref:putative disease resistance protein RGA1 n=1 Tax=Typha latifolia TaxID=4733 RepID=UPI003C3063BC